MGESWSKPFLLQGKVVILLLTQGKGRGESLSIQPKTERQGPSQETSLYIKEY